MKLLTKLDLEAFTDEMRSRGGGVGRSLIAADVGAAAPLRSRSSFRAFRNQGEGRVSERPSLSHLSHIHTTTNLTSTMSYNLHIVEKYMRSHESVQNLLLVDETSLPSGLTSKTRVTSNLRAIYEIEKIAKLFHQSHSNVTVKYIYLHRNFYKTVNSHSALDGGFRRHAVMLEKYAHFIRSEYARTELYKPSIWRAVRYEWLHLLNATDFSHLIDTLVEFLEWKDCTHVNMTRLQLIIKQPRISTFNKRDFQFATSLDTEIGIPFLIDNPLWDEEVAAHAMTSDEISDKYSEPGKSLTTSAVTTTHAGTRLAPTGDNNDKAKYTYYGETGSGVQEKFLFLIPLICVISVFFLLKLT